LFENYLKNLRYKIQNSPKPLEQIYNRLHEEKEILVIKESKSSYPIIHYAQKGAHIKCIELKDFTITSKHPNNCCLLKTNAILFISQIIINNKNKIYISNW